MDIDQHTTVRFHQLTETPLSGYSRISQQEIAMLIGNKPWLYEVDHHFGTLPESIKLGYTHGICVDIEDNVYLFNQSKAAVIIFNRDGKYLRTWGEEFQHGAHGMRLTDEGPYQYLYLTDYERHVVVKTTLHGDEQFTIGVPPRKDLYSGPSEFKPTDACVAPTGDIYVFDGYGKNYVHIYDRKAVYKKTIGGTGSEPGQFNCPHAGWIDTRRVEPELYVADRGNSRIQVFSLGGAFRRIISHPQLEKPCGFYQFKDQLFVPDLNAKLVVLDKSDQVCAVLGDNPEAPKTEGWPNIQGLLRDGKFNSPHACCVDTHGDVYVAEWISTGRVTKLTRKMTTFEKTQH
jgi:DNA-binding beta-propeller fold protein YncE